MTSVGNELNNEGFDFKYDSKHLKLDGDSGEVDDEGHPISIREKPTGNWCIVWRLSN